MSASADSLSVLDRIRRTLVSLKMPRDLPYGMPMRHHGVWCSVYGVRRILLSRGNRCLHR
jgi:hypothetical protein